MIAPTSVRLGPDGRFAYVVDGRITPLQRDRVTGVIAPAATLGCLGLGPSCTLLRGLRAPYDITVTSDGRSAYGTYPGFDERAVVVLARDVTTGALAQLPGSAGCVGSLPCTAARLPANALSLTDPAGRNVYLFGCFLAAFRRLP